MGGIGMFILTDATFLDIEAWESVHLLLKHTEVVVRNLIKEHLLGEKD